MLSETLINTRNGSLTGNGCGGIITAIERPSPGFFIMKTKKCNVCKKSFPATFEYFHKNKSSLRPACKKCENNKKRILIKPKECIYCGGSFTPKNRFQKYCSPHCAYKADREKISLKPKNKRCAVCNKLFTPYTSMSKYCSAECRIENMKSKRIQGRRWSADSIERRMGKNNPSYRNGLYVRGRSKSHVGEKVFLKNIHEIKNNMIDERGHLYCQNCNTSVSLRFEGHHIVYRSEKPNHPNLHIKKNLIVLCIKCHNEFHKHKKYRNKIVEDRNLDEIFGHDVLNK